ncbi:HAMP domain-containing histidine kinase [Nocardioides sp. GY 10113]|uniref:sensor histidine kinase n=1 Tax=Nocardioides sp. GY 10113 TaxID=2569761 RepID=UPI0010A88EC1|nr:HAMP domain-containing sensor histidine kinase [Nocardioides sp. GY 10113]TIC80659.1 HAMP domain-containing histidine kinase [Nocardioides sp. GY 10113]
MTGEVQLEILLVAAGCALAVGLLGLVASWLLRDRSLRWQLTVIALVAVAAPYAGLVAVTQRMFISGHDLTVAMYVGSVSAAVSLLVVLALGTVISRRVGVLRSNVLRLGAGGGDLDPPSGPSEFRALSEALAETQSELEASRVREQRLDQSRRELVSWVSHDLRTPLAGMRAMAEALEDGMAVDPDRYLAQIRSDVDRMSLMVDDLFELSRIHAGGLVPQVESVLLRDVVSEAIASADPVARTRNVSLGGHVADGIKVSADPAALSRAISNLVINAIRHTPEAGAVQVRAEPTADGVELSVIDQCGGIPAADLARVFEVGWQGSAARTPGESGVGRAGLGLAIVRGIVEAHRGAVSVENLAPGTGCRFLIRLPVAGAPGA